MTISRDVSTHSRPKAAGCSGGFAAAMQLCFNTQPPEGGWFSTASNRTVEQVSTHSRPKAAGKNDKFVKTADTVSTHSRPKAAG